MTFGKICVRAFPLVVVLFCVTVRPPVTPASELDAETLAANRELDQKFLNGHAMKSSESLVSLFSSRPDVVFIAPSGTINRGREAIRASFDYFFSLLDEIHGENYLGVVFSRWRRSRRGRNRSVSSEASGRDLRRTDCCLD